MKLKKTIIAVMAGLLAPISGGTADQPLRVAIFPFESETKADTAGLKEFMQRALNEVVNKEASSKPLTLGDKITELVYSHMTGNPMVELVERAKIDKAIDELALGKTGLVDEATAARVGHIVGAQVLVTGRAFPVDDELFIVAKVIGVETSRVFAAKASGSLSGKLTPMVKELSDGVNKVLLKNDAALVGKETKEKDYVALLLGAVGSGPKPKVAVFMKEEHRSGAALDPAAETEIIYLLQKTGFSVTDEKNKPLADWAAAYLEDTSKGVPRGVSKADVILVGEAFSEFAARRGELVSCKARVELRALDAKSGEVLSIDRKTATAVDLAEHMAAKSALQKAADELALTLIPEMSKKWK